MTLNGQKADSLFELGKLYCDRGDFFQAMDKLKSAADAYLDQREISGYLKCQNLLLRLYAETEQEDQIHVTKEKLQDLVLKEGFELNSKTYYTLALCAAYKGQLETALEYCQKALAIALASDHKEDICYAISGTAIVYTRMGRLQEALKEIYNLQIFFEVLSIPEIKISTLILNAHILVDLKKYDQAIDILWQAYEQIKTQKTMLMHIYLLFNMGRAYLKSGDRELARLYLNLAAKAVDPKNMIRLAGQIEEEMSELGQDNRTNYDLIFDIENHTVTERKLGKVDFKNQFILLDLLRLFVQNQGQVYSKEYLVEQVWKQDYDPAVHDNKIYVTIKRLRKMIEPDFEKPKYIFRAKNGYFMNKSAKVLIEQKEGVQL
jgi:tetratricopeptide (TPR) repeat protein